MNDLPEHIQQKIKNVLKQYPQVEQAILFGSRAKGTSKPGSDIDLTLKGKEIDLRVLNRISQDLDDLLLPYTIDMTIYQRITDQDILDHIHRVGKILYSAENESENILK